MLRRATTSSDSQATASWGLFASATNLLSVGASCGGCKCIRGLFRSRSSARRNEAAMQRAAGSS